MSDKAEFARRLLDRVRELDSELGEIELNANQTRQAIEAAQTKLDTVLDELEGASFPPLAPRTGA
jgi:hypothetical protein